MEQPKQRGKLSAITIKPGLMRSDMKRSGAATLGGRSEGIVEVGSDRHVLVEKNEHVELIKVEGGRLGVGQDEAREHKFVLGGR